MGSELREINFLNIYKFERMKATDPRRMKAKHLDDITDYDIEPTLITHLDYDFLLNAVQSFDKTEYVEIFQHCIFISPQNKSSQRSYFFATVSKCIGHRISFVTIWSLIESEMDKFDTKCLQRLKFEMPSVNT